MSLQVDQLSNQNYFPIVPQMQCMIYHFVALSSTFIQCKKHHFTFCYIRLNPGGESHMDSVFYQIVPSSLYHPYLVTTQLIGSNALKLLNLSDLPIPDPGSWIQTQAHYHNATLTIHENPKWNEINMLALKLSLLLTTLSSQIFKICFSTIAKQAFV